MTKTSTSHPLRIDRLEVPSYAGAIGLTFCPGKKQKQAMSGSWDRDLEIDLLTLKEWGATCLISLLEDHELKELSVEALSDSMRKLKIPWYCINIADGGVPSKRNEKEWQEVESRVFEMLSDGEKVVIHCKGGLGRTGTMAARILVEAGVKPESSIAEVRRVRPGAIENKTQENYILRKEWQRGRRSRDNYRGCLLGGAVGDALGAPVEFLSSVNIKEKYGESGIEEFTSAYGKLGAITDDTQMTIFTAEGILRASARAYLRGIGPVMASVTHNAYLRWLVTQGYKDVRVDCDGWLVDVKGLHSSRAPGKTCLNALLSGRMGTMQKPLNNSKGCGGVMRVAPVGLLFDSVFGWTDDDPSFYYNFCFDTGCELAAITHGHPTGYLTAGYFSLLIARIIRGDDLLKAITLTNQHLCKHEGHQETLKIVEYAQELAAQDKGCPKLNSIENIGEGWIAEEALAISIYCSITASEDFGKGIVAAVNHGGDSDSTGAITGNIMGALLGESQIPEKWLRDVELGDVVREVADDLYTDFRDDEIWWDKYPGN